MIFKRKNLMYRIFLGKAQREFFSALAWGCLKTPWDREKEVQEGKGNRNLS